MGGTLRRSAMVLIALDNVSSLVDLLKKEDQLNRGMIGKSEPGQVAYYSGMFVG